MTRKAYIHKQMDQELNEKLL